MLSLRCEMYRIVIISESHPLPTENVYPQTMGRTRSKENLVRIESFYSGVIRIFPRNF